MYKFVKWVSVFPNIETALRIYLSTMCSNCFGQRLFSKLNLIRNHLRSAIKDDRLIVLRIMNIETKLLNLIEFDDILIYSMFLSTKKWENNAQLNQNNSTIAYWNICKNSVISFLETLYFIPAFFYCVAWFRILVIILLSSYPLTVATMTLRV